MDGISSLVNIVGAASLIGSLIFVVIYRAKYTAYTELLEKGNAELRSQNNDIRQEKTDCETQIAVYRTESEQKDETIAKLEQFNSKQADVAALTKLISNNHKETTKLITSKNTEVIKAITQALGGRK